MSYCVTVLFREFLPGDFHPIYHSLYYSTDSVRELNDWLFHHVCNSEKNYEIINLFFEDVKE